MIFQHGRRSPSILRFCANTRPKGGDNPFAEEICWLLCCHGKHQLQHQHQHQADNLNDQMHEKLQYNPVKMYLTSIVIDPLPQLASLGQLEGYIQVGYNHPSHVMSKFVFDKVCWQRWNDYNCSLKCDRHRCDHSPPMFISSNARTAG